MRPEEILSECLEERKVFRLVVVQKINHAFYARFNFPVSFEKKRGGGFMLL
jgi:hypothetical protein